MEFKVINSSDPFLEDIIFLGKKNAKTLGMFPEGAFIEHANKGFIIAAINENNLLGYILFRITQSTGLVSITHLCIDNNYRNKGIAKQLLDQLKKRYQNLFRGISLSCREDYIEASAFYEKNGFIASTRSRSRSKEEKYLIKWMYDFGNQDLFSSTLLSNTKINVLLDANILIKLRDLENNASGEIQALKADWLEDEVDFFYAKEMLNEINRDSNKQRAELTRKFIDQFKQIRWLPFEKEEIEKQISDIIKGKKKNDISDINQISECIAGTLDYFITTDKELLNITNQIYSLYSVKILSPTELVLHIDGLKNELNYRSVKLAGANYEKKSLEVSEINNLVSLFISKKHQEKKYELQNKLSEIISDIKNSYIKTIKDNNNDFNAIIGGVINNGVLDIKLLRTKDSKISSLLINQLLTDTLIYSSENKISKIIVSEQYFKDIELSIIERLGFEKEKYFYSKVIINDVIEWNELLHHSIFNYHKINLDSLVNKINKSTDDKNILLTKIERKFWPLKFKDLNIPTYIIPIKGFWASQLFDFYQAEQSLFGANENTMWQNENVYYRSVKPVSEVAPARILWYVSSDNNKGITRCKGIVACSYIDEVTVASAKNIFHQFKNYGIYEWKDVSELANKTVKSAIKAIKFSGTEVFKEIIELKSINKILVENGRKANTFASPLEVSREIFNMIYEIGKKR